MRGNWRVREVKRVFDLCFGASGLVLLSPLFLAIAIAIWLDDGSPVFYRAVRIGRGGIPFRIWKFRTMCIDAENAGPSSTSEDDPRITRIGRVLRRFKIDELPQILNVVRGEMSFVGPRPQVPWAVALYGAREQALLRVRPGITDYASIVFVDEAAILRGSADPDQQYLEKIAPEKIRLGLEYVENRSLSLDLRIIAATICRLVGISYSGILRIPDSLRTAAPRSEPGQ
jgi:lipopolysaccharide/colanic/teichoic acid biosynthesis glycosyltransferase